MRTPAHLRQLPAIKGETEAEMIARYDTVHTAAFKKALRRFKATGKHQSRWWDEALTFGGYATTFGLTALGEEELAK